MKLENAFISEKNVFETVFHPVPWEGFSLLCFCTSLSSGTIFGNFCTYPDENKYFATVVRCAVFPVSWATICESFEDDESGLLRANSQIFCLSESENILGRPDPTFRPSLSPFSSFFMFRWNVLGAMLDKFCKVFRSWVITHWSIIQEYLAASACFHEIVNKLYVFCFSAAAHERINVKCFEREVPCLYIVWISRTFVGSKILNNPFCKSDIFFAHHYRLPLLAQNCTIICINPNNYLITIST